MPAETIIYHNPNCGTSRKVLGMLRDAGLEPKVIEYLKTTPYDELGLDDAGKSDDDLIDAILAHPILMERPVVVTQHGVKLCRPAEEVATLIA